MDPKPNQPIGYYRGWFLVAFKGDYRRAREAAAAYIKERK